MGLGPREASRPLFFFYSRCVFGHFSLCQGLSAWCYLQFYFCFASDSASLPLTLCLGGWG